MWIEIKPEIFDGNQNIDEIRKLIQDLCHKHRYDIYIDLPKVETFPIYQSIYENIREVIEAYL